MEFTGEQSLQSAVQSESASNDNEYEELSSNWLHMCTVGVAVANSALAAWLQMCSASLALHTPQPRNNHNAREETRRAFVERVSKSEVCCKEMLRISPLAFESLATKLKSRNLVRNYYRATIEEQLGRGDEASGLKETTRNFKRSLEFDALCLDSDGNNCGQFHNIESSSYGYDAFSMEADPNPDTPEECSSRKSGGTMKAKQKRKLTLVAVMEEGYKNMASSIRDLSMALVETGEKVAGAKFDLTQNTAILSALTKLGLDDGFRARCYMYLSSNPSKAAVVVAAPKDLRYELLSDFMAKV